MSVRYSAFSASLLLHLGFGLILAIWSASESVRKPSQSPVWIDLVKLESDRSQRQQIVQTEQGQKTEEAARDAFLGEKTQTVDRQTVSRTRSTQMAKSSKPNQSQTRPVEAARDAPKPLAKLGIAMLPNLKSIPSRATREEGWADVAKVPQDYVRGMRESDRTALNTKEFVYYGYFQRIRERLDRAWVPILRKRVANIYKAGRNLASDAEHTTRVVVVLNLEGEITRVQVLSESGTRDLDQAAVDAFNLAGPFPNPPKGIANEQGIIEIPWEFVLRT